MSWLRMSARGRSDTRESRRSRRCEIHELESAAVLLAARVRKCFAQGVPTCACCSSKSAATKKCGEKGHHISEPAELSKPAAQTRPTESPTLANDDASVLLTLAGSTPPAATEKECSHTWVEG